ncbi:MAG: hypothetical protein NDJ89_06305 [Oligoflexia bacterium]|nr:hypothetical protein [Oligoflexia bacterium]
MCFLSAAGVHAQSEISPLPLPSVAGPVLFGSGGYLTAGPEGVQLFGVSSPTPEPVPNQPGAVQAGAAAQPTELRTEPPTVICRCECPPCEAAAGGLPLQEYVENGRPTDQLTEGPEGFVRGDRAGEVADEAAGEAPGEIPRETEPSPLP